MTWSEVADDRFDYHDEYYSINTGVHRKGGVELVAPTLAHHLGLWFPPLPYAGGSQLSAEKFGLRVDDYVRPHFAALQRLAGFESNFSFKIADKRIVCLFGAAYEVLDDGGLAPFTVTSQAAHSGLREALESDARILFMKVRWHGLAVIVRCEFRSEYATLTRFVTLETQAALPKSFDGLHDGLALLSRLGRGEVCGETDVESSHAALYRDVWETLDRELFCCERLFRADEDAPARTRIFADFRGLIVVGTDAETAGTIASTAIDASRDPVRPFDETWPTAKLIPSVWSFLTVRNGLDLKHREFTASFMLNRRAVYITALGPQPPADDGLRCAPLQYFLVAKPVSDWQLGALVDRLHFMGTVRLAALMEMRALREAGANLRDMEHEAEAARQAIDRDDTEAAVRHYQRAMELIAHKSKSGVPIFHAGLQFRVERSRYYVQRFEDFVPFLGIDPIDGYQRYHHFVRSRLGGVYDYIDRLGRRQQRAVKSTESIFQLISLKETSETNRQIAEANRQSVIANERSAEANAQSAEANAQSAEANAQNSAIARRSMHISRAIEKLQTKAEIALVAVILPHYLMEIVKDFEEERTNESVVRVFWAIVIVGLLIALTSLGEYISDRAKDGDFERIKEICIKYGLLFFCAFCVFVVALNTGR